MVVAVSGGPDSVALLLAILQLPSIPSSWPISTAGTAHASDADENFVRSLYAKLAAIHPNLTLEIDRFNVAALARETRDNLVRHARYRWLAEIARRRGQPFVATGHTAADDQAETVLFRLLRGAGLQGLRGIARCRPLEPEVQVIRPLLDVSRANVLAFLDAMVQDYCMDASNLELH